MAYSLLTSCDLYAQLGNTLETIPPNQRILPTDAVSILLPVMTTRKKKNSKEIAHPINFLTELENTHSIGKHISRLLPDSKKEAHV